MTVEERVAACVEKIGNKLKLGIVAKGYVDLAIGQALRAQIEDCAKVADRETIRLDGLSMEYKQRGDFNTATRFSACTVTSAKLGRDIRALASQTDQTEGKEGER